MPRIRLRSWLGSVGLRWGSPTGPTGTGWGGVGAYYYVAAPPHHRATRCLGRQPRNREPEEITTDAHSATQRGGDFSQGVMR